LGKSETPKLPNNIPLGNSPRFPMVHYPTPNGQRFTSYGYRKKTRLLNSGKFGQTWPFGTNQDFDEISAWPPQKFCIRKNVVNELSFLLVTYMTCFDIQFGHYGILMSGFSAGQVLERPGIQVLGQVFGPQDEWNLLGSEYKICI
jgi:hypothetical protein